MDSENLPAVILRQGVITSIYSSIMAVYCIICIFALISPWPLILSHLVMSIFCAFTGITARTTARIRSSLAASRYNSWSLSNLIVWGAVGAYATIDQVLFVSFFYPAWVVVVVMIFWTLIYGSGLFLFSKFRLVARKYMNSNFSENYQPGAFENRYPQGGYGYVAPPMAANYYPSGANVYYAQPIGGNPNPSAPSPNPPAYSQYPPQNRPN